MNTKTILMIIIAFEGVACRKLSFTSQQATASLFSIDSSGLSEVAGIDSTVSAGKYAVDNGYVKVTDNQFALAGANGDQDSASVAATNAKCGLKPGMRAAMALSYLDGQTTGQLSGTVVLCTEMQGELYRSIEWQSGELCFAPGQLTTTQLVRAPGHTDGNTSLLSMTELCRTYTNFFLALDRKDNGSQSSGLKLSAPNETETPLTRTQLADEIYRAKTVGLKGRLSMALAGENFNFQGTNSFVVDQFETTTTGLSLQGESGSPGAKVRAISDNGFRGFTFSEKGKGPSPSEFSPTTYALSQSAPSSEELGLPPTSSGSAATRDRDLRGGEFQFFMQ